MTKTDEARINQIEQNIENNFPEKSESLKEVKRLIKEKSFFKAAQICSKEKFPLISASLYKEHLFKTQSQKTQKSKNKNIFTNLYTKISWEYVKAINELYNKEEKEESLKYLEEALYYNEKVIDRPYFHISQEKAVSHYKIKVLLNLLQKTMLEMQELSENKKGK